MNNINPLLSDFDITIDERGIMIWYDNKIGEKLKVSKLYEILLLEKISRK